ILSTAADLLYQGTLGLAARRSRYSLLARDHAADRVEIGYANSVTFVRCHHQMRILKLLKNGAKSSARDPCHLLQCGGRRIDNTNFIDHVLPSDNGNKKHQNFCVITKSQSR